MSKQSVFLSYSSRDRDVAARFEDALEGLGLEAFNPVRELRAGEDWRKSYPGGYQALACLDLANDHAAVR